MKTRKRSKKVILVLLCLTVILTIGGTVAYFTSHADAKNTISMGKIDVEVKETVSETEKTDVGATVKAGSAPCWVRVFVTIPKINGIEMYTKGLIKDGKPIEGYDTTLWKYDKDQECYYYRSPVKSSNEDQDLILFNYIRSKSDLDSLLVPNQSDVIVYVEAVQTDPQNTEQIESLDPEKKEQMAIKAFANMKTNNQ